MKINRHRSVENSSSELFCSHRFLDLNAQKVGKTRYRQCKQSAPVLFFYDGKNIFSLCQDHADEYQALGLTIQEHSNVSAS